MWISKCCGYGAVLLPDNSGCFFTLRFRQRLWDLLSGFAKLAKSFYYSLTLEINTNIIHSMTIYILLKQKLLLIFVVFLKVKCTTSAICSGKPVTVVITDQCPGCDSQSILFDLSGTSFGTMASPGEADQLRNVGIEQIQYRRSHIFIYLFSLIYIYIITRKSKIL